MKKIVLMVVAAMMATMNVNAQVENLRHEIGVTYGTGVSTIGDGLGVGMGAALTGTDLKNDKSFGSLSLEYFYHLNNPRMAVGAVACFSKFSNDIEDKATSKIEGDRTRSYYTFMPAFKYYWVNKNYFGFYSKAAAGVTIMVSRVS